MLPEAFVSKSDWFVEALQRSTNNPDTIKKSECDASWQWEKWERSEQPEELPWDSGYLTGRPRKEEETVLLERQKVNLSVFVYGSDEAGWGVGGGGSNKINM